MKAFQLFKYFTIALFAVISVLSTSCNGPEAVTPNNPELGEFQGMLLNEFNEPLPDAVMEVVQVTGGKVAIQGEEVIERDTTDEDGYYNFKKVPSDLSNVDLIIEHPDLQPYRINLGEVLKGKDIKRVIIKAKYKTDCCGQISVQVLSADDSTSINDAIIKLYADSKLKRKAMSDENGSYTFYEVCKGEYWLKVLKEGYKMTIIENIVVRGCDEKDYIKVTAYLQPNNEKDSCCNGVLKVIPKDKETGDVIKGAVVKLRQEGEILQKKENTGDYVEFTNVCEGEYELVVLKEGYDAQEINLKMDCNEEKEITVELQKKECCDGVMYIKVQDKDKKAIAKAEVRLWYNGKKIKVGETNSEGVIKFTGLCEGKYGVDIAKEGFKAIEFLQELGCNDTVEVVKTLQVAEQDSCCKGVVKVLVRDKNKKAIAGAKVILWHNGKAIEDGKTNEDGYVVFDGLCKGGYGMSIQAEGFKGVEFEFELDCNATKTFEKVLQKKECCDGVMYIKVQDKDKKAIAKAEVHLWYNGKKIKVGVTNSEGVIKFTGLCEGKYGVDIAKEGFKAIEFSQELGCNDTVEVVKTLQVSEQDSCCKGVVKVLVRDGNKKAIAGAKVILWHNGKAIEDGKTNEDGYVVFDGLCKGGYGMSIQAEGFKGVEFEFELDCNATKTFEKVLQKKEQDSCCNGKIILNVKDKNEKALSYAAVYLWKGNQKVGLAKTNSDGRVVFEKVCKGQYQISITKEGYKGIEFNFEMGCDETKEFIKTLEKKDSCCTAVMKLVVLNSNKEAIEGAKIIVYKDGKALEDGMTDSEGHWVIDGLCAPATYTVVVKKDGYKAQEFKMEYKDCETLTKKVIMEE